MGSKIMNYAFLFSNTQGKMKSPVNSIQLSKLGTKSVQTQLRAAGIDTNSKQYKTVISQMMKNGNGMMYTNPQAIKNLMKNYDSDGDYICPVTGLAGMDATNIPLSLRRIDKKCLIMQSENFSKKMELLTEIQQKDLMFSIIIRKMLKSRID